MTVPNRRHRTRMTRRITQLVAAAMLAATPALAVPLDTLVTVVDGANATAGKSMAGFAYDPTTDRMYVTSFGFTAPSGGGATVRLIENVSGVQTSVGVMTEAQLQLFLRDGDPTRSVIFAPMGGILFNPQPIGSIPAYGQMWVADASSTRLSGGSTTVDPDATKRFYTYTGEAIPSAGSGSPPAFGDGRDVAAPLVTLAQMQAAIGTTSTATNQGRLFAWSSDGQSIYFNDSGSAFGGIWKITGLDGGGTTVSRILSIASVNTEPAVLDIGGGVDRILFRNPVSSSVQDGIAYIDHDRNTNTTSAPGVLITKARLNEFLDQPASTNVDVRGITSDAEGNIYFNDVNSGGTRTILRLDPQGRLIKLTNQAERVEVFGGNPSLSAPDFQLRKLTHSTAGAITQLMYSENHTDSVSGINIFTVGDFDRDGVVTSADTTAFLGALNVRGSSFAAGALADNFMFDLNGNGGADWKDVKVLQSFLGFADGDVNLDGFLDLVDLDVMAANYHTLGGPADKTWRDGDIASLDKDATLYDAGAVDANLVDFVDLELFARSWQLVLGQTDPTPAALRARGYGDVFFDDVVRAFNLTDTPAAAVPEPAGVMLLSLGAVALMRRRRDAQSRA